MIINKASSYYNQQRLYKDLAWIFPIISPPEDYIEESDALYKYIKQAAKGPVKTLLNLGCGAGHHDYGLKKYFQITGIDLSEKMLSFATKLNPEVGYQQGDFTKLELDKQYDVITIFDAVDYIVHEEELNQLIKTVRAHLNRGGVLLIFPDEILDGFKQNHVFSETRQEANIEVTYIEQVYDPDPHDTEFEVTYIFLIRQADQLEVEIDHHICGLFSLKTWQKLFTSNGFEYHEETFTPHGDQDKHYKVFLGIKPTATDI